MGYKVIVIFLSLFRATDNAVMFKKVVNNDVELESMNDKRASSILLQNGFLTILENLRCKILSFQDIEILEYMLSFCRNISLLMYRVINAFDYRDIPVYNPSPGAFYPLIRQAHQMEIHSLLCYMASLMAHLKRNKYFYTCNKFKHMNQFLKQLQPSLHFLEKFLVSNKHFHCVLPPQEPNKQCKYFRQY